MSAARQLEANRAKAAQSTGPSTRTGKAVARLNALRHGLAASSASEPRADQEIEKLARAIVVDDDQFELLDLARRVAEAEYTLRRVRRARVILPSIPPLLQEVEVVDPNAPAHVMISSEEQPNNNEVDALERYERRALSRRKSAIRDFDAARAASSAQRRQIGD